MAGLNDLIGLFQPNNSMQVTTGASIVQLRFYTAEEQLPNVLSTVRVNKFPTVPPYQTIQQLKLFE